MTSENRLVRILIYREIINELFRGDVRVMQGLPPDATLRRTYRDAERDQFVFVFQSDNFDPVDEGDVVPELKLRAVEDYALEHLTHKWETEYIGKRKTDPKATAYRQCVIDLRELTDDE